MQNVVVKSLRLNSIPYQLNVTTLNSICMQQAFKSAEQPHTRRLSMRSDYDNKAPRAAYKAFTENAQPPHRPFEKLPYGSLRTINAMAQAAIDSLTPNLR